jgi:hypothetical protein
MTSIGFTDNRPHEAAFVVYINGIEVPVQSFEVQMGVNANPTASLQMLPDPLISRLGAEDRVEVAAFYLDDIYPEVIKRGKRADFRLLYEGEITGRSYSNTPVGRQIGFNSVNFLKIMYDLYPYFLTGPESLTMEIANPPQGTDATFVVNSICFPWNRFFYGFDQTQEKLIRRPYDLVMNILNSIVGTKEQSLLGSSVAVNFYARYMTRTGFVNRFLPSPLIETDIMAQDGDEGVFPILRAVKDAEVVKELARGAAEPGMNAAIWPTLQQMFLRMYYEVLAITTAPIAQVERNPDSVDNGVVLGPPKFRVVEDPDKKAQREAEEEAIIYEEAYQAASADVLLMGVTSENYDALFTKLVEDYSAEIRKGQVQQPAEALKPNCILNYITKPQWLFGVTPSCNVIFPSMVQQLQFQEDYASQPTRLYVNDMWYAEHTGGNSPTQKALATLRAGYPEQVQRELDKRYGITDAGISGDVRVSGKNFLVWPEEFYKGPQPENVRLPNWFTMLANYIQTKQSKEQQQAAQAVKDLTAAKSQGDDVQVKLKQLIDGGVLPPQVKNEKSGLYDLTGIVRVLNLRASDQNSAMSALRRGYARYEFFRKRAACRQGAAIITFNPYVIPGFPAFIFDDMATGEHLVAYVVGVTHSLAKDNWSTQITFTYGLMLDEFMQELFDARVGNTAFGVLEDQASAPVNPISPLRDVIQVQERAEDYFSLLLHQKANYPGVKSCAFNFAQAIDLVVPSGESYPFDAIFEEEAVVQKTQTRKEIQAEAEDLIREQTEAYADALADEYGIEYRKLGGLSNDDADILQKELDTKVTNFERNLREDYEKAYGEEQATAPQAKVPSDLLQKYITVRPSDDFAAMFRNHTNAMRFVSRPICTLDEYIAFRGKRGTKSGTVPATDSVQGKGAVFYEKILNLVQGPGDPPTFDQDNNMLTPDIADLPDTRADWESRLKAYRQKVLFKRSGWRHDPEDL